MILRQTFGWLYKHLVDERIHPVIQCIISKIVRFYDPVNDKVTLLTMRWARCAYAATRKNENKERVGGVVSSFSICCDFLWFSPRYSLVHKTSDQATQCITSNIVRFYDPINDEMTLLTMKWAHCAYAATRKNEKKERVGGVVSSFSICRDFLWFSPWYS